MIVIRKDKGRKEELEDYFDVGVRSGDEVEVVLVQKSIVEEFKKYLKSYKKSESAERKTEVVLEKTWQLTQSSYTKSQNLEQDLEDLVDLIIRNDWDKDMEAMISLWTTSKKSIKCRRQDSSSKDWILFTDHWRHCETPEVPEKGRDALIDDDL